MRFATAILCVLLAGCSASSTQTVPFTPVANSCVKASAHDFWSSGVAVICFDANAKPLGIVPGSGAAPVDLVTSSANAAVLGATIPVAATLIRR